MRNIKSTQFMIDIEARALINDCTNKEKFINNLNILKKTYLGIDPTADSLHIGNYLSLTFLKRLEDYGFPTVIILGNFTALIGDPSFKTNERPLLTEKEIEKNIQNIEKQVKKISPKSEIIKNLSFYKDISLINLLKDIGSHMNVSEILGKDFLKDRLQSGLTVTEFLYPLFQSYDFYHLFINHNVSNQIGGSDQWGNITSGIEFIRKKTQNKNTTTGLTLPLLLDENNKKFGKSENNAYFLDEQKTKPYLLYQYIFNISDELVYKYLKYLSFSSLEEINEIYKQHTITPKERLLQKHLALEIITLIHSKEIALQTQNISEQIFKKSYLFSNSDFEVLKNAIPTAEYKESTTILQALKDLSFAKSITESRRLIDTSCIYIFNELITNQQHTLVLKEEKTCFFLIKKGKKDYGLIKLCN